MITILCGLKDDIVQEIEPSMEHEVAMVVFARKFLPVGSHMNVYFPAIEYVVRND